MIILKVKVRFLHSCLPVFAWWRFVLRYFDENICCEFLSPVGDYLSFINYFSDHQFVVVLVENNIQSDYRKLSDFRPEEMFNATSKNNLVEWIAYVSRHPVGPVRNFRYRRYRKVTPNSSRLQATNYKK